MEQLQPWWVQKIKEVLMALVHVLMLNGVIALFVDQNDLLAAEPVIVYFLLVQAALILLSRWFLWLPAVLLLMGYTLYRYFPYQQPFGMEWFLTFLTEIRLLSDQFAGGESLLFPANLALWLMLTLLLFSSIYVLRFRVPWLSIGTSLGYLLLLHVFSVADVLEEMTYVLGYSLLFAGVVKSRLQADWKTNIKNLAFLAAVSLGLSQLGLWSMQHLKNQQQQIQIKTRNYYTDLEAGGFFDWIDLYREGGILRRMGFDENDEVLGGPLKQNFGVVFKAYTDKRHYWRVSTKSLYNGAGWESAEQEEEMFNEAVTDVFSGSSPEGNVDTIYLETSGALGYIPYPYGTRQIDYVEEPFPEAFFLTPAEKIITDTAENDANEFILTVAAPQYTEAALRGVPAEAADPALLDNYTQLPASLPERVTDLARTIAAGAATPYDQVRAIETYFKSGNGFRYSLRETPVVPDGRDYVDYFLFDSQIGYCDNFSTAMVILCRSLGIPTRWAKGYNSGILVENAEEGSYFEITNSNAHSWPEVYFEGYGWIPFEPTPAFSQPLTDTTSDPDNTNKEIPVPEAESTVAPAASSAEPEAGTDGTAEEAAESQPALTETRDETATLSVGMQLVRLFLIVAAAAFLFLQRHLLVYRLVRIVIHHHWLAVHREFALLLMIFNRRQRKEAGQSLREYFGMITQEIPDRRHTIDRFVSLYEQLIYSPFDTVTEKEARFFYESTEEMTDVYREWITHPGSIFSSESH